MVAVSGNVTTVKNAASTVNPTNYTFADGNLTIKADYLAGLSNGEKLFKITTEAGETITITLIVGD